MTIARLFTTDTDDSGSGLNGTVHNNAWLQAIYAKVYDAIDAWIAAVPRASAFNSATQSIANATDTVVTYDSEDFDVGAMHSTSSNTGRMTVPSGQGGVYLVKGRITYATNGTGIRRAIIRKNGSTMMVTNEAPGSATTGPTVEASTLLTLAAADYVELLAHQTSTGALNIGSATRASSGEFQCVKLWD